MGYLHYTGIPYLLHFRKEHYSCIRLKTLSNRPQRIVFLNDTLQGFSRYMRLCIVGTNRDSRSRAQRAAGPSPHTSRLHSLIRRRVSTGVWPHKSHRAYIFLQHSRRLLLRKDNKSLNLPDIICRRPGPALQGTRHQDPSSVLVPETYTLSQHCAAVGVRTQRCSGPLRTCSRSTTEVRRLNLRGRKLKTVVCTPNTVEAGISTLPYSDDY